MSTATKERRQNTEAVEALAFKHFAAYAAPHGFSVNELVGGCWQAKADRWLVNWYQNGEYDLQGPMGFRKHFSGSHRQAIDTLVEMLGTLTTPGQPPHPAPTNGVGMSDAPTGDMQQEAPAESQEAPTEAQAGPIPGETLAQAALRTKDQHRVFVQTTVQETELPPGVILVPQLFGETHEFLSGKVAGLEGALEMFKTYGPEAAQMIEAQLSRFVG